jgi:hypothetical protein
VEEQAGAGLVSTLAGVSAFLVLLLFAVHLVLNLYATSVVNAVTFDAARVVSGSNGGRGAELAAEGKARALLGRYDDEGDLAFQWRYPSTDGDAEPDAVELRVVATHPTHLSLIELPWSEVDRTVTVRLERLR